MSSIKFTKEQATKLFTMQDELNTYIHPEWKTQDFDWCEAIIDECGEIKAHLGWKWWKKDYQCGVTDSNKTQIKLEVIDILHFVASDAIEYGCDPERFAWNAYNTTIPYGSTVETTVNYMRERAVEGYVSVACWAWLAELLDMTAQEIMETYVQKYVLNKFRQDHGYKDGSYVKEWKHEYGDTILTREDNEVLSEIVHELGSDGDDVTNEIMLYTHLKNCYDVRLNK